MPSSNTKPWYLTDMTESLYLDPVYVLPEPTYIVPQPGYRYENVYVPSCACHQTVLVQN